MTDEETAVLLACSEKADALVRRRLGVADEDLAQEVREAMVRNVNTYDPTKGATLKTWLLVKGGYAAIDAYRNTKGRTRGDRTPSARTAIRSPLSLEAATHGVDGDPNRDDSQEHFLAVDDDGYERVESRLTATNVSPAVAAVLREFKERDRAIVLERLAGNSLNEIADIHGVDQSRVSRICTKFRHRFAEHTAGRFAA